MTSWTSSKLFASAVVKEDRSLMNVSFVTPSKERDADVAALAEFLKKYEAEHA